ncbi:hypothetical protein ACRRTK_003310 [Alexandromys fortis]
MDQKKAPVKMVKCPKSGENLAENTVLYRRTLKMLKSKLYNFTRVPAKASKYEGEVSKIWRKLSRKHRVVPKDPEDAQVQVGSSIERQHSEGEVSPEPPNSTTSPEYQRKHPSMKVKMKSAKQKYGPKMWRKFYRKCHRIPKDSNEAQVQADTSIAIQRSEVEVLPEPPNSATSPEYQRKHPIRKVKVKSRKCRCGSYAPSKNVASTVDQRKVRAMEVISKKRRFVPANLTEICEKQATANQDAKMGHMKIEVPANLTEICEKQATANQDAKMGHMKIEVNAQLKRVHRNSMMASKEMPEPNAYNVTTAETTDKKTEELPDHADTTVTPRGPGTMVKMVPTMIGSCIAQVGDTDIEDQQNFDSKESFPDAIEVQQWELRKESSTEHPVINVLFLAPPTSSDEDVVIIKRKRKKKRRRYY